MKKTGLLQDLGCYESNNKIQFNPVDITCIIFGFLAGTEYCKVAGLAGTGYLTSRTELKDTNNLIRLCTAQFFSV